MSHDALQMGRLCEDRVWRQIVTILDAEARGCDLFDLEELRMEYDAPSFENLMMCQFVDDGDSIFPLTMLQPCMVESWDWPDFKPFEMCIRDSRVPEVLKPYMGGIEVIG